LYRSGGCSGLTLRESMLTITTVQSQRVRCATQKTSIGNLPNDTERPGANGWRFTIMWDGHTYMDSGRLQKGSPYCDALKYKTPQTITTMDTQTPSVSLPKAPRSTGNLRWPLCTHNQQPRTTTLPLPTPPSSHEATAYAMPVKPSSNPAPGSVSVVDA
jgi:hypothetical protein